MKLNFRFNFTAGWALLAGAAVVWTYFAILLGTGQGPQSTFGWVGWSIALAVYPAGYLFIGIVAGLREARRAEQRRRLLGGSFAKMSGSLTQLGRSLNGHEATGTPQQVLSWPERGEHDDTPA